MNISSGLSYEKYDLENYNLITKLIVFLHNNERILAYEMDCMIIFTKNLIS